MIIKYYQEVGYIKIVTLQNLFRYFDLGIFHLFPCFSLINNKKFWIIFVNILSKRRDLNTISKLPNILGLQFSYLSLI